MNTRLGTAAVALGLFLAWGRPPVEAAAVGAEMLLRVVDSHGCTRVIEIRPDSTFASSELTPGRYTLWWGTTPAASRRGLERQVASITVWYEARFTSPRVAPPGTGPGAKLSKDLDVASPMLATKVGSMEVPSGSDGIVGRIEFTTGQGRRLALEDWLAPRPTSARR